MQHVLMGLNPERGPAFLSDLDNVLVFLPIFEEDLEHLQPVIEHFREASLKLSPQSVTLFASELSI